MLRGRRRGGGNGLDAWPGYVDALSTLLMVIIFVLLVMVLAQGFLGVALSGRDQSLGKLNQQVASLSRLLDAARVQQDAMQAQAIRLRREAQATSQAAEAQLQAEHLAADARVAASADQIAELQERVRQLLAVLDGDKAATQRQDATIADLNARLDAAMASKLEELRKYRSEFFGRLRDVLAGRPGILIVGDRFVFQSEVLFPAGSADLTQGGVDQLRALAATLLQIARQIPPDLPWVLRVDGHADHQPLTAHSPFASNWELSAQRAINVVKLLVASGIPPGHLAATGFADFQPLSAGETPEAMARNRRIELRLTDR